MLFALFALSLLSTSDPELVDLRELYDVEAYRLDVEVRPQQKEIAGTVGIQVTVVGDDLKSIQLDLEPHCRVQRVVQLFDKLDGSRPLKGKPLPFRQNDVGLICDLPRAAQQGDSVAIAVTYDGKPESVDRFSGFHWSKTESGAPWIDTSCQSIGAHYWWPCKSSFFHPEDKSARLFVNATVPRGLFAVSNGKLVRRSSKGPKWETFHWDHPYPIQTYAVTLSVGPYEHTRSEIKLACHDKPFPFDYFVLPEAADRARVQFAEVPHIVETFARHFGPYPFQEAKLGIVQATFVGKIGRAHV